MSYNSPGDFVKILYLPCGFRPRKVFIVVILMHLCYLFVQFIVAGTLSKKNPFQLMKNQIPGYATAVCLMHGIPISIGSVIPFIMTLGIAMVASPGAPGGSIMTALPFLYMIFGKELGDPNGPICAIMVALYITQDSFGTACNVSGDNAIGVVVNEFYSRMIEKEGKAE